MLSQSSPKPSKDNLTGLKRKLLYIRGKINYGAKFSVLEASKKFAGFSDAYWGGDPDKHI